MQTIYGKGFSMEDRLAVRPMIHSNIISSIKTLCEMSKDFGEGKESKKSARSKAFVEEGLKGDEAITPEIAEHIRLLWEEDPGIASTYEKRSQFQLSDSTAYFFGRLALVAKPEYVPTQDDVLRCRIRTTGIIDSDFNIEGVAFKIYDVGGQRNERKKWMHCFEGVTAVMFVTAISEYDQTLFEDELTNRMTESITLFEEVCKNQWFRSTSIMLFLNKKDLFEEKIQKVPLKNYFPDYDGPDQLKPASDFLLRKFTEKNQLASRKIYPHITCATSQDNVSFVFKSIVDIVIKNSMEAAGMGSGGRLQ